MCIETRNDSIQWEVGVVVVSTVSHGSIFVGLSIVVCFGKALNCSLKHVKGKDLLSN